MEDDKQPDTQVKKRKPNDDTITTNHTSTDTNDSKDSKDSIENASENTNENTSDNKSNQDGQIETFIQLKNPVTIHQLRLDIQRNLLQLAQVGKEGFQEKKLDIKSVVPCPVMYVWNDETSKLKSHYRFDQSCDGIQNMGYLRCLDDNLLVTYMQDAPFGKGSETVYDEKVRKAKQLPASSMVFMDHIHQIQMSDSQMVTRLTGSSTWFNSLAPANHELIPHLYKLHVYEKGGHFEPHVDTLHDVNHFATLLICLPTSFSGGDIHLKNVKEPNWWHIINWSQSSKSHFQALVFYTDMVHQVKPVLSGRRIVLQYDLLLKPKFDSELDSDSQSNSQSNVHVWRQPQSAQVFPIIRDDPNLNQKSDNHSLIQAIKLWFKHTNEPFLDVILCHYYTSENPALKGCDQSLHELILPSFSYEFREDSVWSQLDSEYHDPSHELKIGLFNQHETNRTFWFHHHETKCWKRPYVAFTGNEPEGDWTYSQRYMRIYNPSSSNDNPPDQSNKLNQ